MNKATIKKLSEWRSRKNYHDSVEFVLIQVTFFTASSEQKNITHGKPLHLHTIQKSGVLKTWLSHFSLVWVMEFSIISSFLGKGKVVFFYLFNLTNFDLRSKSQHSVQIRDNTDKKKLRIWTLFAH